MNARVEMDEFEQQFPAEPIATWSDPTQVAEQSVLGALLMAGADAFDKAAGLLSADSFAHPLNGCIWKAVEELVLSGRGVDPVVVLHCLQGKVDDAYADRLPVYLSDLARASTGRLVEHHARIVANLHRLRQVAEVSGKVSELLRDKTLAAEDITSQAVSMFEQIVDEKATSEPESVRDLSVDFLDKLEEAADGKGQTAWETNIPGLDHMLGGGFYPGQLIIIAARPSVGKSSFAQQLTLNLSERGHAAGFLGLEMSKQELMRRTVANLARVPLRLLKTGNLSPDDYGRLPDALERMRDLPLYLDFCPGAKLSDIAAKARKLVRKHGLKFLVIDYLQLMGATNDRQDRRVQLEEITRNCKRMAGQLGITIAILSQLNREVEKRSSPRPVLADLKECGAIEEDADVVLALWDHKKGGIDEASIKGLAAIKGRDIGQSELAMHFEGKYQRWTESTESLAKPENPPTRPHKRYPDDY